MKPTCLANRRFFPSLIAASFGAALMTGGAFAATQTYDAANASNVWDTITTNWDASAATWTNGNNATFSGTGESVAVNGAVSVANLTFSTAGFSIASGTGSFSLAAGTNTVTTTTGTSVISALIGGTGGISKAGTGRLDLTNVGNTFSGGLTTTAGDTYIAGAGTGTAGSPTAGPVGTGTLTLAGGRLVHTAETTIYNNITAQASTSTTLFETSTANFLNLYGNISGSGSITLDANANVGGTKLWGDNSGFSGTLTVGGSGSGRHKFASATAGSTSAKWVLNGTTDSGSMAFGTGTIHFGELTGTATQIRNNSSGTATVSIGALNTSTTWGGRFSNVGTLALTKVGTGTLTVTGNNDYTGPTAVNNGTLYISTGTVQNTDITVNNSATLQLGTSRTIKSLAIPGAGTAKIGGSGTISNNTSLTGAGSTIDLVNTTVDTFNINGATGLTLGGATATDTAVLKLDVGATADKLAVANGLIVDAGGASIQINNLGISAGQNYPLITFGSGSGAGFTTGNGTTVGALKLANPSLSFGVTGSLEVTANGVNLVTTGATPPAAAYWSGSIGSAWNSTTGSNANFTTTAAGGSFLNVLPGANTQVFFSNNSASNLTNTLGENFSILGLTYRGTSGAVSTSGANTLNIGTGGIIVESGNNGATLAVSSLTLGGDQTWENNSANPLIVSAGTISGTSNWLTLQGSGSIQLGGTSLSVLGLDILTNLDLKGTSISASISNSTGNIANTGAANATINANITSDAELSGVISDNGTGSAITLNKSGSSVLTLSGTNTYSGGTNVANGTLKAGNNSAFGTGSVNITAATGILDLNGRTISNAINNNGATGCVITNSSATTATVSSGMNAAGAAGYVISDFTFNGTGDIRWDGALNRTLTTGTITKSGTNTLILNNDNVTSVITGMNLVINGGTVALGKTVTSFTNLTLNSGTLKMDPLYQVGTTFGIWQGSFGNEIVMNGGVWDLNDTGGINNRIKRVSGTGGTITNSGTGDSLLVLAARDVNVVPTVTWGGNIQDGGSGGKVAVTIQDGGSINQVMIFSGTHTYSGVTNILRNTMRAGTAGVFSPNSEFILSNNTESTLDLNGFNNTIGALSGANAASKVLLGSGTLTVGGLGYSGTFNGIISGTGGITKTGSGNLNLTGANTYTGDTTVNAGILGVDGAAIPDTNKLIINSGAAVDVTGNETVSTLEIEGSPMPDGTYGATGSGAANIDDDHFTGSGILTVGAGYSSWATTHAGGQTANLDYDLDGVSNGVEYFMNAPAGFTANPGIVSGSVTWNNGGNIPSSAYGTQFVVQTSSNLTTWTPVGISDPNLNNATGSVSYTLPTGAGKLFVRLVVTPN